MKENFKYLIGYSPTIGTGEEQFMFIPIEGDTGFYIRFHSKHGLLAHPTSDRHYTTSMEWGYRYKDGVVFSPNRKETA